MRAFLAVLFITVSILSCSQQQPPSSRGGPSELSGIAMTVPYRLLIGQSLDDAELTRVEEIVATVFDEVNRIYNDWNPDSELSQLNNHLGAGEKRPISPQLQRLLQLTSDMVQLTEGRFDPCISPLQKLWRRYLEQTPSSRPPESEIAALAPSLGWDKIHFEEGVFWKEHAQTRIDLGGIAKGYCVDLMVERLVAAGYPDCYFDWGGELAARGLHPEGRPWTIFISALGNPDPEQAVATLALSERAIATSGDYMQSWTTDEGGEPCQYSHIVDPLSQQPLRVTATSIASTSVLGISCTQADALATALMMYENADEAQEFVNRVQELYPQLHVWIVTRHTDH